MIGNIIFDKHSTQFILDALNIKTDIPIEDIGGFYKGKIYEKDLFSIMELVDKIKRDERDKKIESWFESGLMDYLTGRKAKELHRILKTGEYRDMSEKDFKKFFLDIKYLLQNV